MYKTTIGNKGEVVNRSEVVDQLEKMASTNIDVSDLDREALLTAVSLLRDDDDTIVLTDEKGEILCEIDGELASTVIHNAVQKYIVDLLRQMVAAEG